MHLSIVLPTLSRVEAARLIAARFRELLPTLQLETIVVTPSAPSCEGASDIRYVRDTGRGIYQAYLAGLNEAVGEYVWLIGDDDFPLDGVSGLTKLLEEKEIDVIASPVIFSNGRFYRPRTRRLPLLLSNWCQQGVVYRRSVLMRYRFYSRLKIQADHFVNVLINADSEVRKCFLHEPVCVFGVHGDSSRRTDWAFLRVRPALARRTLAPLDLIAFHTWDCLAALKRRLSAIIGVKIRSGYRR